MPTHTSAVIIPFPRQTPEPRTTDRLAGALSGLNTALEAQRTAIAEWRLALAALGDTTRDIGAGLADFQNSLTRLSTRVATLHDDAVATGEWADAALAPTGVIGVAPRS